MLCSTRAQHWVAKQVHALLSPFVTPVREATDHRPKEVSRHQRIIGTQTEHVEEAQCMPYYLIDNPKQPQCR